MKNRIIKRIFTSCVYYYLKECGFEKGIRLRAIVTDLVNIVNPNVFNIITICGYIVIVKIKNFFRKVLKTI